MNLINHNLLNIRLSLTVCLFIITTLSMAREPDLESLQITNSEGLVVTYNIEVARTPVQMRRGLMFRDSMPEDRGMLFIYNPERVATMWMKNTVLSLDMLFIDEHGVIITIAKNTTSYSLNTISSQQPVRAVLELNAGQVEKHSLNTGDRVSHSLFEKN